MRRELKATSRTAQGFINWIHLNANCRSCQLPTYNSGEMTACMRACGICPSSSQHHFCDRSPAAPRSPFAKSISRAHALKRPRLSCYRVTVSGTFLATQSCSASSTWKTTMWFGVSLTPFSKNKTLIFAWCAHWFLTLSVL